MCNKSVQELCNVVSMIPMFFMTTYNIISPPTPAPALLFANYSFLMVSICSINYHIFKFLYPNNKQGALQCFQLDAISQDMSFVYISFLTPYHTFAPIIMLGLMMGYGILDFDNPTHKTFRFICNCLFLVYVLHHDNQILFYLFSAALSYVANKLNYLPFGHSAFHFLSTIAVYLLLSSPINVYVKELPQQPEMLFVAYFIIVIHIIPRLYTSDANSIKSINYFLGCLISTCLFIGFCYGYSSTNTPSHPTHIGYDPVISRLLNIDMGNYVAFTLIEYNTAKPEMLFHHVITFTVLALSQYLAIHRLACLTVMLFSASTPFLSAAKYFRSTNQMNAAKLVFGMFTVVFFFCRVVGGLYILRNTLMLEIDTTSYIIIHSIIGTLYIMQLIWMQKIIGMLIKPSLPASSSSHQLVDDRKP